VEALGAESVGGAFLKPTLYINAAGVGNIGDDAAVYTVKTRLHPPADDDAVVIGGGGMFYEGSARNYAQAAIRAFKDGYNRIEILNIGIGELGTDLGQTSAILTAADRVVVRDPGSLEIAKRLGCDFATMEFWPDRDIKAEPYVGGELDADAHHVGVCLKPAGVDYRKTLELAFGEQKGNIIPVCSTRHLHSVSERDDIGFINLSGGFPLSPIQPTTPGQLRYLIEQLDVLVTNRKHPALYALQAGVKVVPIPTNMNGTGIENGVQRLMDDWKKVIQ